MSTFSRTFDLEQPLKFNSELDWKAQSAKPIYGHFSMALHKVIVKLLSAFNILSYMNVEAH